MLKISLLLQILLLSSVFSINCHQCNNLLGSDCYNIEKSNIRTFLKECHEEFNACVIKLRKGDIPVVYRACVNDSWNCDTSKFKCHKCTENGCNSGNEVKINVIKSSINYFSKYWTIAALIGLILLLIIIWCISRRQAQYEI